MMKSYDFCTTLLNSSILFSAIRFEARGIITEPNELETLNVIYISFVAAVKYPTAVTSFRKPRSTVFSCKYMLVITLNTKICIAGFKCRKGCRLWMSTIFLSTYFRRRRKLKILPPKTPNTVYAPYHNISSFVLTKRNSNATDIILTTSPRIATYLKSSIP